MTYNKTIQDYIDTFDGCDKDCDNCLMFLPQDDMCFHEFEKKWKKWNEKRHRDFAQFMEEAK